MSDEPVENCYTFDEVSSYIIVLSGTQDDSVNVNEDRSTSPRQILCPSVKVNKYY